MNLEPETAAPVLLSMKTIFGLLFPFAGIVVSYLPEVETWLRIASLSIGCAVGLWTLWNLWHAPKRNRRK